jgi:hypothetical protein
MTWLSPWAWLGLGVLAVPVLVHLLSRRPARTEPFPSLRFLAATPLRPTRRTRVSDWPLLVVRLAMLAAAVAALAQPSRRAAASPSGTGTRVRVVDTVVAPAPPTDSTGAVETVRTASLDDGIARAISVLRTGPAPRALEVVAMLTAGTPDSALLASIPRDVSLTLTPATPRTAAPRTDTIGVVLDGATADDARALSEASQSLGGAPLALEVAGAATARPVRIVTVGTPRHTGRWSPAATERLRQLSQDATLREQLRGAGALLGADSLGGVVVARTRDGAPALVAHASGSGVTLRLASGAATNLMAATETGPPRAVDVALDASRRAARAQWPAAAPIGAGEQVTDVHRADTLARWGWLAVLALLLVEWQLRRRTQESS